MTATYRQRIAHHQRVLTVLDVGARCIGQLHARRKYPERLLPPPQRRKQVYRHRQQRDGFIFQTRDDEVEFFCAGIGDK